MTSMDVQNVPIPEQQELLKYRGHVLGLDGLRGVAILMVLAAHFLQEGLFKQYYPMLGPVLTKFSLMGLRGVELFFVLSGFLITGILLDSKGGPGFFRNFYARRVLRIFPLYYGTLIVVFWVLPLLISLDPAAREISRHQGWFWSYLSNFPGNPGHGWDGSNVYKMGHFWSLAVEENFYLVWPLVVFLADRRVLRWIAVGLICVGFAARAANAATGDHAYWLFRWSTVSRVDALALGAMIALMLRMKLDQGWLIRHARYGVVGLGVIFVAASMIPRRAPEALVTFIHASVAIWFFACVLILSIRTNSSGFIAKCMKNRVLITFGKYSYGLYVIHGILRPAIQAWIPPEKLIAIVRVPMLGLVLYTLIAAGLCLLLAMLSWHLYESQFLKLKRHFEYTPKPAARGATVNG